MSFAIICCSGVGEEFTVAALQICGGISELGWTWSNNMQGNYVHMSYSCPYLSMPANQALGRPKKRAGNLGIVVWWVHTIQSEAKTWQSMTVSNEILTLHKDWIENNELLSSISIWSWSNLMWCMHGTNKLSILDKGLSMGNTQRFRGPLFLDLKSTHYRNVMPWRKHDFAWGIQEILYTVYIDIFDLPLDLYSVNPLHPHLPMQSMHFLLRMHGLYISSSHFVIDPDLLSKCSVDEACRIKGATRPKVLFGSFGSFWQDSKWIKHHGFQLTLLFAPAASPTSGHPSTAGTAPTLVSGTALWLCGCARPGIFSKVHHNNSIYK